MAEISRNGSVERDIEQALTALKKGAYLLKYGRRGKPKFCPFRLSHDETTLIWYSGKEEKQLGLNAVSRIVPGQRTAIFQRYPRPEKEYQSFSLIYDDRSLDLICKDKDEAEVWFTGLRALVPGGQKRKYRSGVKVDAAVSDINSPVGHTRKNSPLSSPFGSTESLNQEGEDTLNPSPYGSPPCQKALSEGELHPISSKGIFYSHSIGGSAHSVVSDAGSDSVNSQIRVSSLDTFRVSLSSAVSSSSQGSGQDDADALGDVLMWGEGIGDGILGGGTHRVGHTIGLKMDSLLPKALESVVVLDVQNITCGGRHAALVTKQGEVFCWGEEFGGRLGHGVDADVSHPKLVEALANVNVDLVACGEYHTCAVTLSGELHTWGNGTQNFGLLGHGNDASHWMPKQVTGLVEGVRISSISCGPWHTALVTSAGQLFTFGDGTFGVLGHGDKKSTSSPQEVESLRGLKTVRAACGVWHTAAVVEVMVGSASSSNCSSGKLFTWGDGDKGRLGHGDKEQRLVPTCVAALVEYNFRQVACGQSLTVALTTTGKVFTMGSPVYGQLGDPEASGRVPDRVEGNLHEEFVEEIACGAFHVAALTSKSEVYTWGKGANGRLGHGDTGDRSTPTLVQVLKDKQVKGIACGSSFTAAICLHKWVSGADQSMCSGCRMAFGFTRKRHNCYNCGLVFCHACSLKKALKASLAPNPNKTYRVCDPCFLKLKKAAEGSVTSHIPGTRRMGNAPETIEVKENQDRFDVTVQKSQLQISKVAALDQFKVNEKKPFTKQNRRPESSSSQVSPVRNGSLPWEMINNTSSVYAAFGPSRRPLSASVPQSRIVSRATSPSRRSSPHSTMPAPIGLGVKHVDDDAQKTLSQEVLRLQAQVENLTRRCQLQEVELKHTAHQLQNAIAIAGEETAKCKAAKEVIKSLTAQLKDITERFPGGMYHRECQGMVPFSHTGVLNGVHPSLTPRNISTSESNNGSQHCTPKDVPSTTLTIMPDIIANGMGDLPPVMDGPMRTPGRTTMKENTSRLINSIQAEDASSSMTNSVVTENGHEPGMEWVEQDEPGVYLTLTSLPGGGQDLKRVRFSRKRFGEKQAEVWWQENKARVHEQYNVQIVERSTLGPTFLG
eukprot:c29094_g1_i1 orf=1085-4444(-)